jgi:hypothetical protein
MSALFQEDFIIFSSLNRVAHRMDGSSGVLKVIASRLAIILKIKALKRLYMRPSWHNVMVNKCSLFSDQFNRKQTASLAFVLFVNICFTYCGC